MTAAADVPTLAELYAGTSKQPDTTPRAAAKRIRLAIVSAGMNGEGSRVPADGASEAAKAIGWDVDLLDAQLEPGRFAPLIKQATGSGADAIITTSIDCAAAKEAYRAAHESGIVIVAVGGFDCDDPLGGGAPQGYFSGEINYQGKSQSEFYQALGVAEGAFAIRVAGNDVQIIETVLPEFAVARYIQRGFEQAIESSGITVATKVDVLSAEVANGDAITKFQSALSRTPQATWVTSFSSGVTLGVIIPGLGANQRGLKVITGGGGTVGELDLIRKGAVEGGVATSGAWLGWAAVDTVNSLLQDVPIADSGIGFAAVNQDHNLPTEPGTPYQPNVDYRAAYKKAWSGS